MINVTIKNNDLKRLEKSLTDRAAVRAFNVATFAAKQMEVEVVDIVKFYFVTDRTGKRHKKGTTHLVNSFQGKVVGTRGQLPVDAVLGIKRGVNEKKIAALEHGSPPHEIPPGEGGWLAFPRSVLNRGELGTKSQLARASQIRNAYGAKGPRGGKNMFATPNPVQHPGNLAYHFMAQARQRVRQMLRSR